MDEIKALLAGLSLQNMELVSGKGSDGSASNQNVSSHKIRQSWGNSTKLEFPRFSGEALEGWLLRVDYFFEVANVTADDRVKMAALHLEGKAFNGIKGSLSAFEDPLADLRNLKQVSSLQDYLDAFDEIYPKAGIWEDQALSFFLSGLVDELQMPWHNQQLRRKEKLVVGHNPELKQQLLVVFHDSATGGHSGVTATLKKISSLVYWPGLHQDVRQYVRNCFVCQRYKPELTATPGLLQPLPVPTTLFSDVTMDLLNAFLYLVIHNVFHVSQLKHASAPVTASPTLPPMSHIQDAYPQAILDRRMVKRHNAAATQLLIHWRGLSPADASWEYADELQARFPTFLEDKESDGRGS
ncbi:hypothetical protein GH714_040853 [Hevea brasiliensis]|uniref:Chromo domain-containing protein n=1 Tax=Hevea brasiliensis TaxID=3981 RepID=A0A6A6MUG2_HEVBR|nr:hypothetical protein GH714_040853 [Hevea brasiliensis]